jgi:hypothetical protein
MTGDRDDAGIGLIELIVSAALGVVVLVLVGTFFISSFAAQSTVTSTADAAGRGQLLARELEKQIRGASAVLVEPAEVTSGPQVLVVRTISDELDIDYHCEAWFYDPTAEAVFHTSYAGESTWPWGANVATWIDLGSGVTEGGADWSLVASGVLPKGTTAGGATTPVFTAAGSRSATITFEVSAGADNAAVLVETTASGRQPFADEEPTCF